MIKASTGRGHCNRLFFLVGLAFALAACVSCAQSPFLLGGGDDSSIARDIAALWHRDHPEAASLNIAVSSGIVTLTGAVRTPQTEIDAVRNAWQPDAVKGVVNELRVQEVGASGARDTLLTIRLRARITFDPDIISTNYSIVTWGGVIYLMGIAQNQSELDKVTGLAKSVGADKVTSYVRVKAATL